MPVVFLLLLVGNTGAAVAGECPGADTPVSGTDTVSAARSVHCLANLAREAAGAPALAVHPKLEASARAHAEQMVAWRFFGHVDQAGTFYDHLREAGYADSSFVAGGENLAWLGGAATPRSVVNAWLESPGHRANLLDRRLRDSGVAVVAATPTGVPGATFVHHLGAREDAPAVARSPQSKTGKKVTKGGKAKKVKKGKKTKRRWNPSRSRRS